MALSDKECWDVEVCGAGQVSVLIKYVLSGASPLSCLRLSSTRPHVILVTWSFSKIPTNIDT